MTNLKNRQNRKRAGNRMAVIFIFLSLVVKTTVCQKLPPAYGVLISSADSAYKAGDFLLSGELYAKAFESFNGKGMVNDRFKAACAYARSANNDAAFFNLFRIVERTNWSELDFLIGEPDLQSLRSDERWSKLVNRVRKNKAISEAVLNKPLAKELDQLFYNDQRYRIVLDSMDLFQHGEFSIRDSLHKLMQDQDSLNQIQATTVFAKYGWPGPEEVGSKGSKALFLVMHHADSTFKRKYLPLMKQAVRNGKANPADYAEAEDTYRLELGRGQWYGSKLMFNDSTGLYELVKTDDPKNLNKRRREIGLETAEEYLNKWNATRSRK